MLAEGVLESAVVSGLVMEQSGQGSSFSGLLASPLCSCLYRRLTCAVNTKRNYCIVEFFIFYEAALQQCIIATVYQMSIELQTIIYLFIVALYTFIAKSEN